MMDLLENLTNHPASEVRDALSTDLLSHVLAQIRLTGDKVDSGALATTQAAKLDPEMAHVLIVTEGTLTLQDERQTVTIATGDLLLLPHGPQEMRLAAINTPATYIICRFWFDPDSLRVMVHALPPWIHISKQDGAGWLDNIVHFMMIEADDVQPGAALMISRLIDLVVIRTLRSWVQQGHTSGWLGGLVDPRIARAVKAIHEKPSQRWSIEALAGIAGMSRSSFCDRFATLVGRPPLRYHNEWRLALARSQLAHPDARIGEIGLSIGYESEAAFSRAYKALYGRSPRADLKLRRGADPG